MTPIVCAILVNYNGDADTIECLSSLKAQTGIDCRPLVVDNASAPGSVERIRAAHPDTEIIGAGRNLGFAGGNNLGIRRALETGCDFLFLVNNDTALEPNCVSLLTQCARQTPRAAVIAPAMYWYSDRTRPWFTGSRVDTAHGEIKHVLTDLRGAGIHAPFEIPWVTGCAMLVPAAAMQQIGGFDARYFCYWEDVDWSFRARAAGYGLTLCPDAVLYHKVSASAKKVRAHALYYETRNALQFFSSTWGTVEGPRGQRGLLGRYRAHALRQSGEMFAGFRHALREEAAIYVKFLLIKYILRRLQPSRRQGFSAERGPLSAHFWRTLAQGKSACALLLGVLDFQRRRFGPCRYRWLL